MRRRRDQADAGRRVSDLGDPAVHLVPRQLAALAGLGALRHLYLKILGIDEILAGHAEARRRHLLDGAIPRIAVRVADVPGRIFSTLAGIRLAADPVHRDCERLVRFLADRAVGHRAGREPPDDRFDRLAFFNWKPLRRPLQLEQAAQRRAVPALIVDELRVFLEDGVLAAPRGVLQLEDRVRVEQVILAVAPPLVLAARIELGQGPGLVLERAAMPLDGFLGDDVDADAADPRRRPGEVLVDEGT